MYRDKNQAVKNLIKTKYNLKRPHDEELVVGGKLIKEIPSKWISSKKMTEQTTSWRHTKT